MQSNMFHELINTMITITNAIYNFLGVKSNNVSQLNH